MPLEREARNRFRAQTNRRNYAIVLGIGKGGALQSRIAKLIVQAIKIRGAGAIELLRAALVEDRGTQLEDFCKFSNQLFRERFGVVDQQDRPAECV